MSRPNYSKIYMDLISLKYPNKLHACLDTLNKKELTTLDIIELNNIISNSKTDICKNQKHKSFQKNDIYLILDYQKKHNLNNTQTSLHFNISRNSLAKWKKLFYSLS